MNNIIIFHTNDFHSTLYEEKIKRLLSKERSYLLFDSGDAIYGSSTYFKWNEPVLEKMNRLEFNAMAMGNREFHYFRSVVRRRVRAVKFPVLATNLLDLTGSLNGIVEPYIILDYNGIKIGVFGLTVAQYCENGWQEKLTRFRFIDYCKAANNAVKELRNKGAQFIILLSHTGIKQDKSIAEKVNGIDLILGGHSHTVISSPVYVGNTAIAHAGAYGKFLGKIEITFELDKKKIRVTKLQGGLLPVREEFQYEMNVANGKNNILFISNGYGEDAIAASVISKTLKITENNIVAFPIVGEGKAYKKLGVPVIGPCKIMPSEGLSSWMNPVNFIKDLQQGLVRLFINQWKFLKDISDKVDIVVAVGDIFPVIMAQLFVRKPIVFIGTAKSDYVSGYSLLEQRWLRKCVKVFARDEQTMHTLRSYNVPAFYAGNAMMDNLKPQGIDFGINEGEEIVALLPGSRENAYNDFSIILAAVEELAKESIKFCFLTAIPDSLDIDRIKDIIPPDRWNMLAEIESQDNGVVGRYSFDGKNGRGITLLLIKGYFADVLSACRLVIGQAGTGNEQAAGLGKPVVAFDVMAEKKLKWYRRRQKKLLGDAVSIVLNDPVIIAREVIAILNNKDKEKLMSETGKGRMGVPGASLQMAKEIEELLKNVV